MVEPDPHDLEAEQWLLSAMMQSSAAVDAAMEAGWEPGHMFRPAHQEIARAIVLLFATDAAADPITLAEWIRRDGGFRGSFQPKYLTDLYGLPALPDHAATYAVRVREAAGERRLAELGTRTTDLARNRGTMSLAEAVAQVQAGLDKVIGEEPEKSRPLSVAEFLARPEPEAFTGLEWVILGLLEAGERVIVGSEEGSGKSVLGLQVAMCAAAGLHPFLATAIPPVRALYVDLENRMRTLKRRLRRGEELAARTGTWDPARFAVFHDQNGIDLRRAEGQHRLMQAIRNHRPNLIVAGPMYQMGLDDEQAKGDHKAVKDFWGRAVDRSGAALWLETHPPLAGTRTGRVQRPFGSAIWTHWPEFGIWLAETEKGSGRYRLGRFRKDRETDRSWPDEIWWRSGHGWPWEALYPAGTFQPSMPAADEAADELARRRAAKAPYVE